MVDPTIKIAMDEIKRQREVLEVFICFQKRKIRFMSCATHKKVIRVL